MKIEVENNYARIVEGSDEERRWARELLSIAKPQFKRNYRSGRVERTGFDVITFVNPDGSFPAGFTRQLWSEAKKAGHTLQLIDCRHAPNLQLADVDLSYLRDYQREALEAVVQRRRGVVHHPTAAGKTVLATAIVQRIPIRWLFLVQQRDLLWQTREKYLKFTGQTAKIIGDGTIDLDQDSNLTVAMVQTLNARRDQEAVWELIRDTEGLLVDEAHQVPASSLFKLVMSTRNAFFRIGLSGTPFNRGDQRGALTVGALGPTIHRVKADRLISEGFLSKPRIRMYEIAQQSERATFAGAYTDLVTRSVKRNSLLVDMMQQATKPNLTFVKAIQHGRFLKERAEKRGLRVEFVWGDKDTEARQAAIKRLIRGDADCIIASVVFNQGIDIPELASVVIGSGGKSTIATLQRIGRGMRVAEGKTTFEVFDVADTGNSWMQRHAQQRRRDYEHEGHTVEIVPEGGT